jgi:hypothetical protein
MVVKPFYTVGELATRYRLPEWLTRRIVDALGADVPRAGQYRLVPHSLLRRIEEEMQRRGHLAQGEGMPR